MITGDLCLHRSLKQKVAARQFIPLISSGNGGSLWQTSLVLRRQLSQHNDPGTDIKINNNTAVARRISPLFEYKNSMIRKENRETVREKRLWFERTTRGSFYRQGTLISLRRKVDLQTSRHMQHNHPASFCFIHSVKSFEQ